MISFKIGNENRPVVESMDFDKSIFSRQYRTALNIVEVYFQSQPTNDSVRDNSAFQGVAFCGERGEGKTSAMLSVINILRDANKYVGRGSRSATEENAGVEYIIDVLGKDTPLLQKRTSILNPIDPTRFANYNILEVILSELYDAVNLYRQDEKESGRETFSYNEIYRLFQNVKRSIEMLSKTEDKFFDTLEDLEDLSSVIKLQQNFRTLVQEYLRLNKTDRLIISIDDMDMKITGTFELTERLRKYLAIPEVIVLMSVKTEQLLSTVKHALRKDLNYDKISFPRNEIDRMAEKYVAKLLPQGCRVNMTMEIRIFDEKFKVLNQKDEVIYEGETLKDGILELIFIKTRYLFYNSLGEVSTLFPTNLRELVHLIGMIAEMRDIKDKGGDIHRANQEQFKNYFFTVWTECLEAMDRVKALEWSSSTTDYTLNKDVVMYLKSKLSQYIGRTDSLDGTDVFDQVPFGRSIKDENGKIRESILDPSNYTYNVSLGDVFFILAGIEKEVLPEKDYNLIFFIRSMYSIKMYDKYDYITHNHLIFPPGADSGGIYRNDERFNHVNALQRLLGGSYFTFTPGEYLSVSQDSTSRLVPLDRKVILGDKGLNNLISEIVDGEQNSYEAIQKMNLAEFFILTISHSVSSKNNMAGENNMYPAKYMTEARKNSDPIAFSRFSAGRGFYEFNILAPFVNLVNVRFAYYRFENGDKLFDKALRAPDSLLCKIWRNAWEIRTVEGNDWEKHYIDIMQKCSTSDEMFRMKIIEEEFKSLVSVAVIRNGEVLVALSDHFRKTSEEIVREGYGEGKSDAFSESETLKNRIIKRLIRFYAKTASGRMAMSTHRFTTSPKDHDRHTISFTFCKVLEDFLKSLLLKTETDESNDNLKRFIQIYNWNSDKENGNPKNQIKDENKPESNVEKKDALKQYMRILFQEIGFERPETRTFEDLFGWLKFPDTTDDREIQKCVHALVALKDFFSASRFSSSVGVAAWIERVDKAPTLWFELLSNKYFLDQAEELSNSINNS